MDARWLLVGLVVSLALPEAAGVAAQQPKGDPPAPPKLGKEERVFVSAKKGGLSGIAFSPDGKLLGTAGGDKVVQLWSLETGKEVARLEGHKGFIRTVAFSPDGKLLASAGDGEGAILWDVAARKELRRVGKHTDGLRLATFSPDGKTLATSGFDEHIGLWDVSTGKQLHFFRAHPRVPYAVAFSPDGKVLASGGDKEGTIRLWDVATGKQLRHWEGHAGYVMTVAFSPDGRLLASGGESAVRLWEVASGKEVQRLKTNIQGVVARVEFAPDGRTLLVGSYDNKVTLWEMTTGQQLHCFVHHKDWVWGVAYAPDGRAVASCSSDGSAVVRRLGPLPANRSGAAPLTEAELDGAWRDLAGADAARAFQAALTLAAAPAEQVAPFLQRRLRPVKPAHIAAGHVERLIRDLDGKTFKVREAAARELEALGEEAGPALRKALAGPASLEMGRRLQTLVAKLDALGFHPERLRAVRALRVLEDLDTPATRKHLAELAAGVADDLLTREAGAALARLTRRPRVVP
jgi:tricorn protease-like protein